MRPEALNLWFLTIMAHLDFEKPIYELQAKIDELKNFGSEKNITLDPEVKKLEEKLEQMKAEIYDNLTAWQRIQIARHPDRPYTFDFIRNERDPWAKAYASDPNKYSVPEEVTLLEKELNLGLNSH